MPSVYTVSRLQVSVDTFGNYTALVDLDSEPWEDESYKPVCHLLGLQLVACHIIGHAGVCSAQSSAMQRVIYVQQLVADNSGMAACDGIGLNIACTSAHAERPGQESRIYIQSNRLGPRASGSRAAHETDSPLFFASKAHIQIQNSMTLFADHPTLRTSSCSTLLSDSYQNFAS